jgi:hypothetical protein
MQSPAFWAFFAFSSVTVVAALGGGFWALWQNSKGANSALGLLLLFMGASLAAMLGSLLIIQKKTKGTTKREVG